MAHNSHSSAILSTILVTERLSSSITSLCSRFIQDAHIKLQRIRQRRHETGIVLKLKESWVGVDTVTFVGYLVTQGICKLSHARKAAIAAMTMPRSRSHVSNCTAWIARLYTCRLQVVSWRLGLWLRCTLWCLAVWRRCSTVPEACFWVQPLRTTPN